MKPIPHILLAGLALTVVACESRPHLPAQLVSQDSAILFDTVTGLPTTYRFRFGNVGQTPTFDLTAALHGDLESFTVVDDQCTGVALAPMSWCSVQVQLANDDPGEYLGQLQVADAARNLDVSVSMSGRVAPAALAVTADATTDVTQGQSASVLVTVTNDGGGRSGVLAVDMKGAPVDYDKCSKTTLAGGASCTFIVSYAADFNFTGTATLRGTVGGEPGGTADVAVTFNAVPGPTLQITSVDLGTHDPAEGFTQYFTIRNPGTQPTAPLQLTLGSATGTPAIATPPFALGSTPWDACSGVSLPAKSSCMTPVYASFDLPIPGMYTAQLTATAVGLHPATASVKITTVLAHGLLSISKSGTGDGQIAHVNPSWDACMAGAMTCAEIALVDGRSETFTATAANSSLFTGWDAGPCKGSTNPSCTVTGAHQADVSIDAVFTKL